MDMRRAISEIEAIAALNGIVPGQVCANAKGNFRLYERMRRPRLPTRQADGYLIRVTFSFVPVGAATKGVVVHRDIPSNVACSVQQDGWQGTLCRLEGLINEGVG